MAAIIQHCGRAKSIVYRDKMELGNEQQFQKVILDILWAETIKITDLYAFVFMPTFSFTNQRSSETNIICNSSPSEILNPKIVSTYITYMELKDATQADGLL